MKLTNLPNLESLKKRAEEWAALQLILTIDSPESRWQLLQIWLREHDDWQQLIEQILATSSNHDCLALILAKLEISQSLIEIFDRDGKIRDKASLYIGVIKQLYSDRLNHTKRLK